MKTVRNLLTYSFSALLALLLAACGGHKGEESHAHGASGEEGHGHGHEEGVTFSEKTGLSVPKETAEFIGLEIIDVEEREIAATTEFTAQVYNAQSNVVLASGFVSREIGSLLKRGTALAGQTPNGIVADVRVTAVKTNAPNGLVEALLEIPSGTTFKIGDVVTIPVQTGAKGKVVTVPKRALLKTVEGHFVYTVSGERLVRAPVKVGAINHEFVEITDGLYAGDQIAVQPVMTLWLAELQSIRGGKACADGH